MFVFVKMFKVLRRRRCLRKGFLHGCSKDKKEYAPGGWRNKYLICNISFYIKIQ